jgi:fructokinase
LFLFFGLWQVKDRPSSAIPVGPKGSVVSAFVLITGAGRASMLKTRSSSDPAVTPDVIVIGEALVDVVASGDGTIEHPGGSPMNVAYGLGRLGVRTTLLTSIGDDERGASIDDHLGSAGVKLLQGSKSMGRTGSATAVLRSDGSASYDFDISWELSPTAPAYLPKVLHTGSIATFLAPGATAVKTLLHQSHGACMVTYDPNIRPALLGSQAEAPVQSLRTGAPDRRGQAQ